MMEKERIRTRIGWEKLIRNAFGKDFIDDFCCPGDIDLTFQSLIDGWRRALRELNEKFDNDEISLEEYNKIKEALDALYSYYYTALQNSKSKSSSNASETSNDDTFTEEFIDLPDFVIPDSPEASMYIEMYKKYFGCGDEEVPLEKKEMFDKTFCEQVYGERLKTSGELGKIDADKLDIGNGDINTDNGMNHHRYVKDSKELFDVFDDLANKIMGSSSGGRRL